MKVEKPTGGPTEGRPPARAEKRLRQQAEDFVRKAPQQVSRLPKADIQQLVQELQVYQVELEMQNEHLNTANHDLDAARRKYTNLYEFAPVGYLTVDAAGTILETNLTAARLLGVERAFLIGRPLGQYVIESDRPVLSTHLEQVLARRHKQTCDLHMLKVGRSKFPASLESIPTPETRGLGVQCWMVLIDLTAQRQMEEDLHQLNAELTKKVQAYEVIMGELKAAKDDLAEKNEALERFYEIVVDRELKMVDLEREVHNLKQRPGKDQPGHEPPG